MNLFFLFYKHFEKHHITVTAITFCYDNSSPVSFIVWIAISHAHCLFFFVVVTLEHNRTSETGEWKKYNIDRTPINTQAPDGSVRRAQGSGYKKAIIVKLMSVYIANAAIIPLKSMCWNHTSPLYTHCLLSHSLNSFRSLAPIQLPDWKWFDGISVCSCPNLLK